MPINTRVFWLGYALKRANNHTQQSALLVVSKSYSSSTFILFAALLVATHGAAKSVSVDDDDARTQYSPVGWDRDFALDKTKVFDGTLHTGTANSTDVFFTFVFNGTSIEIRYVRSTTPGTVLNLKYIIDGTQVPANSRRELVGRVPTIAERWAYNQTLVRVDGLTNTEHKLEVHFSQHDQLFFDYLIYEGGDTGSVVPSEGMRSTGTSTKPSSTFSTSASGVNGLGTVSASVSGVPSPRGLNIGPVIGGVVSAVVATVLIIILYYFLKRRRDAGLHLVVTPYEGEEFSRGRTPPMKSTTRPPKNDTLSPGMNRMPGSLADESVEVGRMSSATALGGASSGIIRAHPLSSWRN